MFSKNVKDALSRCLYTYRTTLRQEYMIEIPKPNSDPIDLASMKENDAGDLCYSISLDEEIDGKELPLLSARKRCWYGDAINPVDQINLLTLKLNKMSFSLHDLSSLTNENRTPFEMKYQITYHNLTKS